VKNSGGELELWYNTRKWNAYTAYTYTQGSVTTKYDASGFVKTNDTSYNNLYRVPVHAISSSIHYTVNKNWVVGTLVKYVGERQEPVYNAAPKPLTSYVTIDLSGQYHFNQQIRAFADLRNITNAAYFDVLGYNNRRFNFTVGLAVRL
jgi:vitamin B12 transporter